MDIKRIITYQVPFREITKGDVFLWGTNYYMRINSNSFNAINLGTGEVTDFSDNEIVAPIDNCYLAIE